MKIKVCIPYYGNYDACVSGLKELEACKEHEFKILTAKNSLLTKARNDLINNKFSSEMYQTLDNNFDAYLTIDSDISFTLSNVLKLIEHGKDIVCAPVLSSSPNRKGLYECGKFKDTLGEIGYRYPKTQKGFHRVDWSGPAFMLVKKKVFEEMEYPWYRHTMVKNDTKQDESGEDIGFCIGAKLSGFDIWCDFSIKVIHNIRNPQMNKEKAKEHIRLYYQQTLDFQRNKEKREAQMIAIIELMEWTPEETNEILGSNVMAPIKKEEVIA